MFRIVIPARLRSTRLPNKPLLEIEGRALVLRVVDCAHAAGAKEVFVATDSQEIVEAVGSAARAEMTSPTAASGTDRAAELSERFGWTDDEIVVNLQGDEPLMPPEIPARLARMLNENPSAAIATLAGPIAHAEELFDPNVVKVVTDDAGFALYFSRAPIPWCREAFQSSRADVELPNDVSFLRHVGIYAYRAGTLRRLTHQPPLVLEKAEALEQLRALAMGIRIHVSVVGDPPPAGVDTPDDLERTRAHFRARS